MILVRYPCLDLLRTNVGDDRRYLFVRDVLLRRHLAELPVMGFHAELHSRVERCIGMVSGGTTTHPEPRLPNRHRLGGAML